MKHIFHYLNDTTKKHFVYIAENFTYGTYSSAWMNDSNLPKRDTVLIPDLDTVKEENIFSFNTEKEAMEKIALEYGKQSTAIRQLLIDSLLVLKGENESMVDHINLITKLEKFLKGDRNGTQNKTQCIKSAT